MSRGGRCGCSASGGGSSVSGGGGGGCCLTVPLLGVVVRGIGGVLWFDRLLSASWMQLLLHREVRMKT